MIYNVTITIVCTLFSKMHINMECKDISISANIGGGGGGGGGGTRVGWLFCLLTSPILEKQKVSF